MKWKYCKKCAQMNEHLDMVCTKCGNVKNVDDDYNPLNNLNLDELKIIVSQSMFLASLNDARMTMLMDWLQSYSTFTLVEGQLESAMIQAQENAVHKVGDYLKEILEMEHEIVFQEALRIKLK